MTVTVAVTVTVSVSVSVSVTVAVAVAVLDARRIRIEAGVAAGNCLSYDLAMGYPRQLTAISVWAVLSVVATAGCGDEGEEEPEFAGDFGFGQDERWWCVCNSGVSVPVGAPHDGPAPRELCEQSCADQGGLADVQARLSAEGTAECDEFCAKVATLPCDAQCDPDLWCAVAPGSCLEAKRAELQCKAEGTFECDQDGWVVHADCKSFESLCN